MACSMQSHERKVTIVLDFPDLSAITAEPQIFERHFVVCLPARPVESLGPALIPKPVANKVRIALDQGLAPAKRDGV